VVEVLGALDEDRHGAGLGKGVGYGLRDKGLDLLLGI
jgi:hypothetical protein